MGELDNLGEKYSSADPVGALDALGEKYSIQKTPTLAEKVVKTSFAPYKAGANLDLTSPSSVVNAAKTVATNPAGILEFLAGAENKVTGAKSAALGNLLRENKIPGQNYPTARGATVAALDIPSTAAFGVQGLLSAMGVPFPKFGGTVNIPGGNILRNSNVAETGIENAVQKMGQPGLTQEEVGNAARDSYGARITASLEQKKAQPNPSDLEQFGRSTLEKTVQQISPQKSGAVEFGNTAKNRYKENVMGLYEKEQQAHNLIGEEFADAPTSTDKLHNYMQDVMSQHGISAEPTYLERLPSQLQEAAKQSNNPEEFARLYVQSSQGKRALVADAAQRKIQLETGQEVPQITKGNNILNKLNEIASSPEISYGALKNARTTIGGMIKSWGQRGTPLEHILKGAYKAMSEDMIDGSVKNGFGKEAADANQATREFFDYVDKPSSKIIENNVYPEDLIKRLIKPNSPTRAQELLTEHNFTPEEQQSLKRGVLDSMGGDIGKVKNILSNWTPETKQAFFGKDAQSVTDLTDQLNSLDSKVKQVKVSDILSQDEMTLNKLMNKGSASEVVDNLLSNGTPEIARLVKSSINPNTFKLVQRGIIEKILTKKDLDSGLNSLDPEFVKEMFGNDSKQIFALGEASAKLKEGLGETRYTPYNPIPGMRQKMFLINLYQKYRLPSKIYSLLEKTGEQGLAEQVVSPRKINIPSPKGNMRIINPTDNRKEVMQEVFQ